MGSSQSARSCSGTQCFARWRWRLCASLHPVVPAVAELFRNGQCSSAVDWFRRAVAAPSLLLHCLSLTSGLREASKEIHGGVPNLPWIAQRVTKVGGGNPDRASLHELFAKVDADPQWFPGKHNGAKRGPPVLLTAAKRRCIAESAMAAKKNKHQEPCVKAVILACPDATRNPNTKKPFSDRIIRQVFTEDCYDVDPERPWKFQTALQKVFLPASVKLHRDTMSKHILRQSSWYICGDSYEKIIDACAPNSL